MKKEFIKIKKNQVSSALMRQYLISKTHQCALLWTDKCAYCEAAFDELKNELLSSTEPTEDSLNELRRKIEESPDTLEGLARLVNSNLI